MGIYDRGKTQVTRNRARFEVAMEGTLEGASELVRVSVPVPCPHSLRPLPGSIGCQLQAAGGVTRRSTGPALVCPGSHFHS